MQTIYGTEILEKFSVLKISSAEDLCTWNSQEKIFSALFLLQICWATESLEETSKPSTSLVGPVHNTFSSKILVQIFTADFYASQIFEKTSNQNSSSGSLAPEFSKKSNCNLNYTSIFIVIFNATMGCEAYHFLCS